jgi:hypothetical protein
VRLQRGEINSALRAGEQKRHTEEEEKEVEECGRLAELKDERQDRTYGRRHARVENEHYHPVKHD